MDLFFEILHCFDLDIWVSDCLSYSKPVQIVRSVRKALLKIDLFSENHLLHVAEDFFYFLSYEMHSLENCAHNPLFPLSGKKSKTLISQAFADALKEYFIFVYVSL